MERTRFIEHRGVRVLLLDWTGLDNPAEVVSQIEKNKAFVRTHPPKSLLGLTEVTGSRFTPDLLQGLKEMAAHNEPYVKAAAVVTRTPLHLIAFRTVVIFTRRNLKAFETREEALEWLVTQA
jgi:hypothetical protein